MEPDISNKTIVVLVILTVVISVLSTLVVLNEIGNLKIDASRASQRSSQSTGQVSLVVLPEPVLTTGMVSLEIKE